MRRSVVFGRETVSVQLDHCHKTLLLRGKGQAKILKRVRRVRERDDAHVTSPGPLQPRSATSPDPRRLIPNRVCHPTHPHHELTPVDTATLAESRWLT